MRRAVFLYLAIGLIISGLSTGENIRECPSRINHPYRGLEISMLIGVAVWPAYLVAGLYLTANHVNLPPQGCSQ